MTDKYSGSPLLRGPRENERRKSTEKDLPRKEADTEAVPDEVTQEDVEETLKDVGKSALKPLTPEQLQEQYYKGLEAVGVTVDEARRILDEILFEKYHEETFKLNSKRSFKLRTRVYRDVERALRRIEAEAPTLPSHFEDLLCRYNVAASLAAFGDDTYSFPDRTKDKNVTAEAVEDAFEQRWEVVMSLPTAVFHRIHQSLVKFDLKMQAILAEGAPEDF